MIGILDIGIQSQIDNVSYYSGADADVNAFCTAAQISDTTIGNALDTFVTSLKSDGYWSYFTVIYPFVGGTALSHSINLKNPATYQITWSGSVTHDSNGITGDASSAYGLTGIYTNAATNNGAIVLYNRTNLPTTGGYWYGSQKTGLYRSGNYMYHHYNAASAVTSCTGGAGLDLVTLYGGFKQMIGNWRATSAINSAESQTRNGILCYRNSWSASTTADELAILARNDNGTMTGFTNANISFFAWSTGNHSDNGNRNLYTSNQAFQTALSRQIS